MTGDSRDRGPTNAIEKRVHKKMDDDDDRARTGASWDDTDDAGPAEDRPAGPDVSSMDPDQYGGNDSA